MNSRQKERLQENLEEIQKRSATLLRVLANNDNDLDTAEISDNISESLKLLNDCISKGLSLQKKRGKEFISDIDIDDIVSKAIKEEITVKKFDDFKEDN